MNIPLLQHIENVSYPLALSQLQKFYAGPAQRFRVYLDDACAMPADWRQNWAAPKQAPGYGDAHWATKYGAQGFIPHMLEQSPFITPDWRQADASVVVLLARHYAGSGIGHRAGLTAALTAARCCLMQVR